MGLPILAMRVTSWCFGRSLHQFIGSFCTASWSRLDSTSYCRVCYNFCLGCSSPRFRLRWLPLKTTTILSGFESLSSFRKHRTCFKLWPSGRSHWTTLFATLTYRNISVVILSITLSPSHSAVTPGRLMV